MTNLGFYDFLPLLPIGSPGTRSNQYLIARQDLMKSSWYYIQIIAKRIFSLKIKTES